MDKLEYLNQISQSNRTKSPSSSKNSQKSLPTLLLKILIGAVVVTIILIGIVAIANNGKTKSSDLQKQLYTRIINLNKTLGTYNSSLKSSRLRSIGVSLSGTLTNASNQLSNYITLNSSGKDPLVPSTKVSETETTLSDNLNTTLNNAKLNGILDRIYANQIKLQVSLLISLDTSLIARTKDPALLNILNQLWSSLSVIEQSFNDYSSPSD